MSFMDTIRTVHIAAGFTALAVLALPYLAPKGGRLHRRAGWVYVGAMTVVAATALAACAWRLFYDPRPRVRAFAVFLAYLSLLAATCASMGVRVLRAKARSAAHRSAWDLGLPALLVLAGVGLAAFGVARGSALFVVFAAIGGATGAQQLLYWRRPPRGRMHWWYEHMAGMAGSSVATLTAFLVTNVHRLGFDSFALVIWVAPGLIGTIALAAAQRHYRRRFGDSRAVSGAAAR